MDSFIELSYFNTKFEFDSHKPVLLYYLVKAWNHCRIPSSMSRVLWSSLFHLFMSGIFPAINVKAKLCSNCEDRSD